MVFQCKNIAIRRNHAQNDTQMSESSSIPSNNSIQSSIYLAQANEHTESEATAQSFNEQQPQKQIMPHLRKYRKY